MSKFRALCIKFHERRIFELPDDPMKSAERSVAKDVLEQDLNTHEEKLPARYRQAFVMPLRGNLETLKKQLKSGKIKDLDDEAATDVEIEVESIDTATVLIGTVTDWSNPKLVEPMRQLQGAACSISNGARDRLRREPNSVDVSRMSPLVTFSATTALGPHALKVEWVQKLLPSARAEYLPAIVAIPAGYRNDPVLWGVLPHEIVGHDVINAISDPSSSQTIGSPSRREFPIIREFKGIVGACVDIPRQWRGIWQDWMDEVVADVAAILAMGPSYVVNLAAWLSASAAGAPGGPYGSLGQLQTKVIVHDSEIATHHPPDLLRLYVALGVVDALRELQPPLTRNWDVLIHEIIAGTTCRTKTIDFVDRNSGSVTACYSLDLLGRQAIRIGKEIATANLSVLDGRSMLDVMPWTQKDEEIVDGVANSGDIVTDPLATAAHLLAWATMETYNDPSTYDCVSERLQNTFEKYYMNDKDFGGKNHPIHSNS